VRGSREQKLREKVVKGDAQKEVVTACIASKQNIAPKLIDAWRTPNTTHLLMEDFELGTLWDVLEGDHTPAYYEEVDLAMEDLYTRLVAGAIICQHDVHPGNVVFRRHAGKLQAQMIDFGRASQDVTCNFPGMWLTLIDFIVDEKLQFMPRMLAMKGAAKPVVDFINLDSTEPSSRAPSYS
jgi:hypothetical protein